MADKKRGKRGTKSNPAGGPDPDNRNVGSAKGRMFEQREKRRIFGAIANQARDDREPTPSLTTRFSKKGK